MLHRATISLSHWGLYQVRSPAGFKHMAACPCTYCCPRAGERHHAAKLTEQDVVAIRASRRSQRDIAAEYGIAVSTVFNILARRIWKHI
jgi:hypothetical protein